MQYFKEACALAKRTPNAKWSTVAVNNRNVAIATRKRLHEQLIAAQNTALTKGETILAAQGQATLDELAEIHTDVRDLRTGQDAMQKKLDDLHNVAILGRAPVNAEGHCDGCNDKSVSAQSRCAKGFWTTRVEIQKEANKEDI